MLLSLNSGMVFSISGTWRTIKSFGRDVTRNGISTYQINDILKLKRSSAVPQLKEKPTSYWLKAAKAEALAFDHLNPLPRAEVAMPHKICKTCSDASGQACASIAPHLRRRHMLQIHSTLWYRLEMIVHRTVL